MEKTEILIVGAGALGTFYGAMLQKGGAKVTTLVRSDYHIVKPRGFSISSINGDFRFTPDLIINTLSEYPGIPDIVVVAVKVIAGTDIPALIKGVVHKKTTIMLIQNGINIEENIKNAFPDNRLISCLAYICASRPAPGMVDHQEGGKLVIGSYKSDAADVCELIKGLFDKAGLPCSIDNDIARARWSKLIWNAAFNTIAVIGGGVDTKEILDNEDALRLVRHVMEEIVMIANKAGHELDENIIDRNISLTYDMKPYKPSMLQDYEQKRPMEVEAILGNPIRIARELDLKTPYLDSLYALLQLVEKKNIAIS